MNLDYNRSRARHGWSELLRHTLENIKEGGEGLNYMSGKVAKMLAGTILMPDETSSKDQALRKSINFMGFLAKEYGAIIGASFPTASKFVKYMSRKLDELGVELNGNIKMVLKQHYSWLLESELISSVYSIKVPPSKAHDILKQLPREAVEKVKKVLEDEGWIAESKINLVWAIKDVLKDDLALACSLGLIPVYEE